MDKLRNTMIFLGCVAALLLVRDVVTDVLTAWVHSWL